MELETSGTYCISTKSIRVAALHVCGRDVLHGAGLVAAVWAGVSEQEKPREGFQLWGLKMMDGLLSLFLKQ